MRIYIVLIIAISLLPRFSYAGGMDDDPLLTMLVVEQLEIRDTDGKNPLVWEAEGWIGKDLHKFWIKTEGEYVDDRTEEMELQMLYSRAVAPFWDLQLGWRHDIRPTPERDWFAFGLKGLAPYYFDVDTALFIGDAGRTAARLQAEYEFMLTQKLVLVPEVELNFHGKNDSDTGTGSGLSDIEVGVRLRYELRREFAPYVGLNWTKLYGNTADFARAEGEDVDDIQLVFGVSFWF
ncbi:MAG: copper resistance protein B [Desulfuromonadales bacterium]